MAFSGNGYRILRVGNSEVPLTIEEGEASSLTNRAYPIFFTKDLDIVYKKLRDHGVKAGEIQKDGVNTFFDFYDLDHNKLQVCFWE
nr:hypothetical protein [Virgibacillus oceani]